MSSSTVGVNTPNMLSVNRDTSEVFLGRNTFENGSYTNSTGDEVTLEAGTLMGKIAATSVLDTLKSAASDGSQYPFGILASPVVVADGATVTVSVAVSGDVAKGKVILDGTDVMTTVIEDRQIQDRIAGDTLGIKLLAATENTRHDN